MKYFFEPRKRKIQLPFGFARNSDRTLNYNFLKNENFIPFGFTFARVIPRSVFDRLNIVQQRSQILDYAVLDDEIFGERYEFAGEFDFSSESFPPRFLPTTKPTMKAARFRFRANSPSSI